MAHRQICAVLFCMLFMSLACAAPDASPRFGLSIRAGLALDEALQELARQAGIQVVFFSQITAGRSAPELSGEYTLDAAMTRLLEGSDLTFRQINEQTVEVRQAPLRSAALPLEARRSTPASNHPIEEVFVIAKAEQLVATRIPTPLQDIPQSISVISPEQIRQQNSFELGDVLLNTPGIAVRRINSQSETAYSRGFDVTSYHVDGGSALTQAINNTNIYQGSPDLSEFDRVEVLRGSDALFSGNNNPGGTVSLVRKRPLATPSFQMSTTLGSWNNYRVELDATGPLTNDGALRARTDVVYGTRDYFFDRAHQDRKKIFAVVEYDLTPTSTLTAGGSYQRDDALPLATPATLNFDRGDSHLPRSTSLTFDWSYLNTRMSQVYLQYRQQIADDWILKLNAAEGRTSADYGLGSFRGIFLRDSQSLGTPSATFSARPDHFTLDTVDVTLTGKLDWFGLRETIAIGGDFGRRRGSQHVNIYPRFGPPLTDVPNYDPAEYPDPRSTPAGYFITDAKAVLEQYGGFAWMQVDLNDAWSLSVGARVSSDSFRVDGGLGAGAPGIGEFHHVIDLSREDGNSHVVQPYGALMYRINDHLSWYASYADIYRNQFYRYLRPDGKSVGPQHGITFESGIKGVWRDGALNASLAVYQVEQRHVATGAGMPPSDVPFCCYRTSSGRSQGAELEVDGELAPGWLIGSGYTYNRIETASGDTPFTSTPRHDLKVWTSAQLRGAFSRWTVGGTLRAQSKFHGNEGIKCNKPVKECVYDIVLMRPYAVVDLRAGFELDPTWQVALSVNNVLDKRYYLSHNSPYFEVWYGDPRNFMLRIDAKY